MIYMGVLSIFFPVKINWSMCFEAMNNNVMRYVSPIHFLWTSYVQKEILDQKLTYMHKLFICKKKGGRGVGKGEGQICVHPLVDLDNEEQTSYFWMRNLSGANSLDQLQPP